MSKNFNVEDYIKDLAPELQEKARQCKNMDELMELAGEEGVELSDEALANVSGGCGSSSSCKHKGYDGLVSAAEKIGSGGVQGETKYKITKVRCTACGAEVSITPFEVTYPDSWSPYSQKVKMNDVL